MEIGGAVLALRQGFFVTRRGWHGQGQYLGLQAAGRHPYFPQVAEYVYLASTTGGGDRVPWTATQTDLLATDWERADPAGRS